MSEVLPYDIMLKVRGSFSWINDFADIPDHLSGGLFYVQELLKFISVECQAKLGESLHWARNEQRLSIEQAAAKVQCRIQYIDDIETGQKAIDLKLLCRLLKLYLSYYT